MKVSNNILLTKEEISVLPMIKYEGSICIVTDQESLALATKKLELQKVIGFDTETPPTFKKGCMKPPTLIQLATEDEVFLIQLAHVSIDEKLANILASPDIKKAGVAIHDDMKALAKLYPFEPDGLVELSCTSKQKGLNAFGLRTITANLLGFRVSKGSRCSNWANLKLSNQQVIYAATDAWLGLLLYNKLNEMPDRVSDKIYSKRSVNKK